MLYGDYSSSMTGFYKFIFAPLWMAGFGLGTFLLFTHPESVTFNGVRGGAPAGIEWLFLAAWLGGSAFVLFISWRLAWLRVSDGVLYVTKVRKEIPVKPGWVRSVKGLGLRPRVISIKFMDELGRDHTVWVMPAFNWPSGTPADPALLTELQELVEQARVPAA
jgi:hypothetical protein